MEIKKLSSERAGNFINLRHTSKKIIAGYKIKPAIVIYKVIIIFSLKFLSNCSLLMIKNIF